MGHRRPWSWLTALKPSSLPQVLELASSTGMSLVLVADKCAEAESNDGASFTVSVCLNGAHTSYDPTKTTLWVSDPCPLSTIDQGSSLDPLLLQLFREATARGPKYSSADASVLSLDHLSLLPLDRCGHEFSNFFELLLLCRLFWLCACDAPPEVGSLYFSMLTSNIETALHCRSTIRDVLLSAGVDWEVCFMRAVGYMLAKLCILKELSSSSSFSSLKISGLCSYSYAVEQHGLWVLRGYAPVISMGVCHQLGQSNLRAREPLLRYALAHQQLETVVQLEYSVCVRDDRYIKISFRVDNIRINVARLGFGERELEPSAPDERHFPSRVKVYVGPHASSTLSRQVVGLSLARPTGNPEREVQKEQALKGRLDGRRGGKEKPAKVKATTRTLMTERVASWRWEQQAEGNTAALEGVLCDGSTGVEVATWRAPAPAPAGGGDPRSGMRRRYGGPGRAFGKDGGLVVGGDEGGEFVSWRVGRDVRGKVLRWRLGVKVWVCYCANEINSGYFETRLVDWKEELELPIPV